MQDFAKMQAIVAENTRILEVMQPEVMQPEVAAARSGCKHPNSRSDAARSGCKHPDSRSDAAWSGCPHPKQRRKRKKQRRKRSWHCGDKSHHEQLVFLF